MKYKVYTCNGIHCTMIYESGKVLEAEGVYFNMKRLKRYDDVYIGLWKHGKNIGTVRPERVKRV